MIRRLLLQTLLSAALITSVSCDSAGQPRQLPTPTFSATELFPHLDRQKTAPPTAPDDFESRIEELMTGDDPNTDTAPTRSTQLVPLGASLTAQIPDDHDQWRWSRQDNTTLISFTPAGEDTPELLILTQTYPYLTAQLPSLAIQQFLSDVAPGLLHSFDLPRHLKDITPDELSLTAPTDQPQTISADELIDQLLGTSTLTGHRGLGFRTQRSSFSGWRHLGENSAGVFLRLATAQGDWGPQPTLPDALNPRELQQLLDDSGQDLRLAIPSPPTTRAPNRPAQLIIGQAELSPSQGIYLAIFCTSDPQCPQAPHITHLLDRLQASQTPPSGRPIDHDQHLSLLGLTLN